jgi:transaldolase/glucose-6-phosphate isomerase
MNPLKDKRQELIHGLKDRQLLNLGGYKSQVDARLVSWKEHQFSRRLWDRDHTLWFPEFQPEITDRLGWLELPETMQKRLGDLRSFAQRVKEEGISYVVLLGMGGSSLAPEVFQKTFGNAPGYPELLVLDSTHPSAVGAAEEKIDLARTLFLVSSKSGTTLETLSLFRYFWNQVSSSTDNPGHHFVAITDPGTPLMKLAKERDFRQVFQSNPDVGGRYSAFTYFGLVPAALIGMDVQRLMDRARIASESTASWVSEDKASGLILGAALGELAKSRDKLTFLTSSSLEFFPAWLEQLIAESTGKDGKGIIPVVNEPPVSIEGYGKDRFFVGLSLETDNGRGLEKQMKAFEEAGHPTVLISLKEKYDLAQEIFCWEVAIASAGAVLGIQPFNQPDVQLAKDLAREAMEKIQEPEGKSKGSAETFSVGEAGALSGAFKNWIAQAQSRDYIAVQAYLSPNADTTRALQRIRSGLLKHKQLATTLGYGPRFLHSTGQLHKGGPNTGLFLQLVDRPSINLSIPETDYSFNTLIKAQALGDYQALKQRKRRVLRVDLMSDVRGGFDRLLELIENRTSFF